MMERRQTGQRWQRASWTRAAMQALNASVAGNAHAFGFSITVTVTYGVISTAHHSPSLLELMGFALSAVAAFSTLNLLAAHLLRLRPPDPTPVRALLVSTASDFLAVGAGIGAAIGIGYTLPGWGAWLLGPFCAGVVYVLVQSVELAVGRRETADENE